jgi:hypothetical protein
MVGAKSSVYGPADDAYQFRLDFFEKIFCYQEARDYPGCNSGQKHSKAWRYWVTAPGAARYHQSRKPDPLYPSSAKSELIDLTSPF